MNKYNFKIEKNVLTEILINEFKRIKTFNKKYKDLIDVVNINEVMDDEYAFLIGFNDGNYPLIYKDDDFFSDKEKELLELDSSSTMNIIEKNILVNNIKNTKNIFISYKEKTPFNEYHKSNIIQELGYKEESNPQKVYGYSNDLNKLLLSIDLDKFIKYSETSEELELLYNNYLSIDYLSYNNKYNKIEKEKLYKLIKNELILSYSSLDNYYKCKFRYYLNNILKLDKYEETFAIYIGNLFHYILSICFNVGFDFEYEYNNYISEHEFSAKEKFFLKKLKEDLKFIINTINKQYSRSSFKDAFYENKFSISMDSIIKVSFIGFIDKILYKEQDGKTLLAIVDYKTGLQELNLNNSYYGLNMQLPIYLYLSKNGDIKNSEVVGFYLQKILNNEIVINDKKTYEQQKEDNLKLQGYSLYDERYLFEFDNTYESSQNIKSLSKGKDGFKSYSKLLTKKQMDSLYRLVDDKIIEARDKILEADFEINPKRINFKNVSCEYCKYKDICFMKEKDEIVLEDIKSLDFLGGDEDAKLD